MSSLITSAYTQVKGLIWFTFYSIVGLVSIYLLLFWDTVGFGPRPCVFWQLSLTCNTDCHNNPDPVALVLLKSYSFFAEFQSVWAHNLPPRPIHMLLLCGGLCDFPGRTKIYILTSHYTLSAFLQVLIVVISKWTSETSNGSNSGTTIYLLDLHEPPFLHF